MQIDMHYYGTYCLARSAGVEKDVATRIARSAQYVDDSNAHEREIDDHEDGGKFATVVTAHTGLSGQNRDLDDQRLVWVPFHFIPGNEGDTFSQRLVCRKNSDIAREMIEHHMEFDAEFSPELVGVGMHVYADTFAHYGFAGISSRVNRVDADSIKLTQSDAVAENFLGKTLHSWLGKWGGLISNYRRLSNVAAEKVTGALGHGGVSLYPDAPFLEWEYEYEFPEQAGVKKVHRNNHDDYMEAAECMWEYFREYSEYYPDENIDAHADFEDYREVFAEIYRNEGNKHERTEAWHEVAASGDLGFQEEIPEYDHESIDAEHDNFSELDSSDYAPELYAYRFHQAATVHRDYVAKILLPSHGLVVW